MARGTWISILAVVVVAGLGGGLAWAFLNPGSGSSLSASPTVRDVLASPQRYYGHRVVVQGRVSAVYNGHALTLGPPVQPGLVVTVQKLPSGIGTNAEIRVTGVARRFSVTAWESWSGYRSGAGILDSYEGKPAVRAFRVERVGGGAKQPSTVPPNPQVKPATTSGG